MQAKAGLMHSPVSLIALFFISLAVALGASRLGHSKTEVDDSQLPILVETLGSNMGEFLPVSDLYIARVEAAQKVELGFDISSVLTHIYKREGESFEKGELLAELDTRRLRARKAELEASFDRSVAMLELAKASLKRIRGLRASGNVSEQALDEALRQREAAEADRSLAKAQLSSVALEIEKSKLYAPFEGVVVDRLSDVGRTVSLGLPVLLIEQSAEPEVRASLPLSVAKTLQLEDAVRLYDDDRMLAGRVERINLSLSDTRASEIYITVSNVKEALVPGEILQVELPAEEVLEGVWLPLTALAEYGRGLWSVYLAKPGTEQGIKLSRTIVEVERVRGEYALVRGGLSQDMRPHVVKEATHRIIVGQSVRLSPVEQVTGAY